LMFLLIEPRWTDIPTIINLQSSINNDIGDPDEPRPLPTQDSSNSSFDQLLSICLFL